MRSECGARARSRKPLPGGSGPPLGRHHDRSPRSSVDSRQIEAGNARQIGSQETRELELSQRRMRSPWRVPQQSAGRRARPERARCRPERRRAAQTTHLSAWRRWLACAFRRSAPFFAGSELIFGNDVVVVGKARARESAARMNLSVPAQMPSPLPTGERSARLSVPGEGRPSFRPLPWQGR